jgi:site-specific recombinase XerD
VNNFLFTSMNIKKHTFSVLPFTRTSRSKNDTKLPVYLRITVDGKRAELSTKEYVEADKWSKEKGRVKGNSEAIRGINHRIEVWENKIKDIYSELLEKNKHITPTILKNIALGIEEKENTLISLFEHHKAEVEAGLNIDYAPGTVKNYSATLKHLRGFVLKNYKNTDILLNEINYDFLTRFESYLKKDCKNSRNGSLKHIQRLRKVVNLAMKRGLLDRDPFAKYKAAKEKVNREFLSEDELRIIETIEISSTSLKMVRDVFVFICYTGLSYSDLKELSQDDIRLGIDGDLWIFIDRNKTGQVSNLPLLPPAVKILEKYQDNPFVLNRGGILPVFSNQKLNGYLKELATVCGIKKKISCHIGRHTFATSVTLSNDIPIETVSKMLGHASLRTTQIYAKVIETKVSRDMQKLKNKLKEKEKGRKKADS